MAVAIGAGVPPAPVHAQLSSDPATKKPKKDDTIVVTGRRAPVQRTIDGARYDEHNNPEAQAGSAEDLLNTIPSVHVASDGSGTVTVRGDAHVQIYVNGKPAISETTLQGISGSSVASVDVITSPSAKYDAGGGTIIDLTLKKARGDGLHSTAVVNGGDHKRANVALNNSYSHGPFSATLDASVRDDVRFTDIADDTRMLGSDGPPAERFVTTARYTPIHAISADLSSTLGYALSDASDLGADLSLSHGSPKDIVYERHLDYASDDRLVSDYQRIRGGGYFENAHDYSIYYEKRGSASTGSLKLLAQDSAKDVTSDRLFTTIPVLPDAGASKQRVFNRWGSRIDRLTLDYDRPIGRGVRLSMGSELKRERGHVYNGRATLNGASDTGGGDAPLDLFQTTQRVSALYLDINAKSGPWTLEAGARYQHTGISTWLRSSDRRGDRDYSGLNSSLAIVRRIGSDQATLRLSDTKQQIDPGDLNPALVYIDARTRHQGNPSLAPQSVASVEAEYDHNRGSLAGSATLYYHRTTDTIEPYTRFEADNVLIRTEVNGGASKSYGAELTVSESLSKSVKYSVTGNVFRSELAAIDDAGTHLAARFSYTAQGSLDWDVTRNASLHLDADVEGPTLVPQGTRSGMSSINLVLRRTLSPRLSLSLTFHGIVQDAHVRTVLDTGSTIDVNDTFVSKRAVIAGFEYKMF